MGVLRTFEQSCKSAADASQKQLLSILKDNADTEYGKNIIFQISVPYLNTRNNPKQPV